VPWIAWVPVFSAYVVLVVLPVVAWVAALSVVGCVVGVAVVVGIVVGDAVGRWSSQGLLPVVVGLVGKGCRLTRGW